MNWYRHPDTVDRLASEYVMGSMLPRVKRRFEQVMLQRSEVALAVEDWSERTLPLLMSLPELTPSPGMWAEVERRTQGASAAAQVAAKGASNAPDKAPWWQRWLGTVPASALAFGLVLGLALPVAVNMHRGQPADADEMQLPQSYVGVLATAEGKPGLIVSSLRKGTMVDFKELSPVAVAAGHTLFLWRIDKAGVASPLGAVPAPQAKFAHLRLSEPAEKVFFPAVELAVSIEPSGSLPAQPSGAYVYRGLCGKLWK
jgi:anti-sigma-K factor RskA